MTHLFADSDSLLDASASMASLHDFAVTGLGLAGAATIGGSYSPASGFNQMGAIHGFSLKSAPGSASEVFKSLCDELTNVRQNLRTTGGAFAAQDSTASVAFDFADVGGMVQRSVEKLSARETSGTSPLHKEPVLVAPDPSITTLLAKLSASNGAAASSSQGIWNELALRTADIAEGMYGLANYIGGSNSGAAPDAIGARLRNVAARTRVISGNSGIFQSNLGALEAFRTERTANVATAKASLDAMRATGPEGMAAAEVAEKMFLLQYAATTQASLTGLIPPVVNLTTPDLSNPGQSLDIGMNEVPGTGMRYSTNGVVVPQALADQVLDYAAKNPESFEAINSVTRDMASHAGGDLDQGLFSPQGIATEAATTTSGFPPAPTLGGASPASTGLTPSLAASPSGVANPGLAALNGAGAGLTPLSAPGVGATGTRSSTAHQPAVGSGGVAGQRSGAGIDALPGNARSLNSSLRSGPIGGSSFGAGQGSAAAPNSEGETARRSSGPATASNSPAASGSSAQQGRASGSSSPAMANGGRGAAKENKRSKVRSVVSQVEREGNLRDLLGQKKAVVPGVIGDWVREDPALAGQER